VNHTAIDRGGLELFFHEVSPFPSMFWGRLESVTNALASWGRAAKSSAHLRGRAVIPRRRRHDALAGWTAGPMAYWMVMAPVIARDDE
jgi:hypothetical protein